MNEPIRTVDLDAFLAEKERTPKYLTYLGKQYQMADGLPASVGINLIRLQANVGEEGEIPAIEIDNFGKRLFPETWEMILSAVTMDDLPEILKMALEVYTGEAPKAESPTSPKKARASA